MLKIYVSNSKYGGMGKPRHILLSDNDSDVYRISGCLLNNFNEKCGYSKTWNKTAFRKLPSSESIDINLDELGNDVKLIGDKLLVDSGESYSRDSCVINLKEGTIDEIDHIETYQMMNPFTIKLIDIGKTDLKIYKHGDLDYSDIIISSKTKLNTDSIEGFLLRHSEINQTIRSMYNSGYGNGFNVRAFKTTKEVDINFNYKHMELRGDKLLFKKDGASATPRNGRYHSSVINFKKGFVSGMNEVDLSEYRKNNPLIIKLKNKS